MDTVYFVLPAVTVLHVIADQGRVDTLTAVTAKLSGLLRTQVEVQSSVLSLSSITAGAVAKIPFLGSDR